MVTGNYPVVPEGRRHGWVPLRGRAGMVLTQTGAGIRPCQHPSQYQVAVRRTWSITPRISSRSYPAIFHRSRIKLLGIQNPDQHLTLTRIREGNHTFETTILKAIPEDNIRIKLVPLHSCGVGDHGGVVFRVSLHRCFFHRLATRLTNVLRRLWMCSILP